MFESITIWIVEVIGQIGYLGIFALMFLESSFFPFPSEIVMIPAGYLAYQGEMNLYVCIAMGIAGSLAGAYFNYYLAVLIGRPIIEKYGKWIGLSPPKFAKVNSFFNTHGEISTFTGRLIPGIRQIISFPAGLARMNLAKFSLYTGLGAGIWVTILVLLGFWVGHNQELVKEYSKNVSGWMVVGCIALIIIYVYIYKKKHPSPTTQTPSGNHGDTPQ